MILSFIYLYCFCFSKQKNSISVLGRKKLGGLVRALYNDYTSCDHILALESSIFLIYKIQCMCYFSKVVRFKEGLNTYVIKRHIKDMIRGTLMYKKTKRCLIS